MSYSDLKISSLVLNFLPNSWEFLALSDESNAFECSDERSVIPANDCSFPFTYKGHRFTSGIQTVWDPIDACNKYSCMVAHRK